jgi:hypothetical protein
MNAAEQIQLSYINTTDTGINTFARWRQINAKDGKVLDEIFVGK